MKVIAIAAVTAGGKTTTVNEIKKQLSNVQTLHFDDYVFEGEVDNFYQWVLDDPFAYYNEQIRKYIDVAFFIDTPLDIALARRILRDMGNASVHDIRNSVPSFFPCQGL